MDSIARDCYYFDDEGGDGGGGGGLSQTPHPGPHINTELKSINPGTHNLVSGHIKLA